MWIDLDMTDEIYPVRWKRTCRIADLSGRSTSG